MSKHRFWIVLALAACVAAPAWGGTVYAPLVVDQDVVGNRFTTEIRVTNTSHEPRSLSYLYVAAHLDGTVPNRGMESVDVTLKALRSLVLTDVVPPGSLGFLEITAPAEVAVTSRLVGTTVEGEVRSGTDVPVITSANVVPGGKTILLQGWSRNGDPKVVTNFFLLNLSHEQNLCEVSIRRKGGSLVIAQSVSVPALGLQPYEDVLGLLGMAKPTEVHATVTCDRSFHAYAVVTDLTTADLVYVPPSGSGESSLVAPGQGPPPPDVPCPDGAWFEKTGAFFRPTVGKEIRRFELPLADGQQFSKVTVDLDVTPGDWATPSNGNHSIFWLNRTLKWTGNVFGYVNVFGPNKNFVKISTNADLAPKAELWAATGDAVLEKGEKYHVHYTFDTSTRTMEAVLTLETGTSGETEVTRVSRDVPARTIRSASKSFFIYFGHPTDTMGPEVRTYGWLYSNLCLQIE